MCEKTGQSVEDNRSFNIIPSDTLPSYTICPIKETETVILEEVEGVPPQKVLKYDCQSGQSRDSNNANKTDIEDNFQTDQLEEGINANKNDIEDDIPCSDKLKDDMTEIIWRALENMKCAQDKTLNFSMSIHVLIVRILSQTLFVANIAPMGCSPLIMLTQYVGS